MGSEIKTEAAKLYPAEKIAHETHEKSKKMILCLFLNFVGMNLNLVAANLFLKKTIFGYYNHQDFKMQT